LSEALTVYGKIGVKVWIFRGEVYGKRDLSINLGQGSDAKPDRKRTTRRRRDNK
jgi:small subunit ribosomal protein S3